jgi:hypothetical protein
MGSPAFTPPPLESYEGPAKFTPPPLSSYEGPAKEGSHPLDSIGHGIHEFWNKVNPVSQVQGIADAIRHPVDAAQAAGAQNLDLWNKAKESYNNGDYAGAVRHGINYAVNGIPGLGASIDSAGDQFAKGDYAGGAGSSLGIGTSLVAGAKAPAIMADTAAMPARLIGKTGAPERMYTSALKPSTRLGMEDRHALVNTGLREGIPVSETGSEKLGAKMDTINAEIKNRISDAALHGDTIDPRAVASRVDQLRPTFANQVNPMSDLDALRASKDEFLNGPGAGPIPVDLAQDIKQGTYRQVKKSYGQLSNAQTEAQKALARGIKEEIAAKYPEVAGLNATDSGLIRLDGAIDKAVARIQNHQIFGIGTPLAGAGAKAMTGSSGVAMVAGAARGMLDNPMIKSQLAIVLRRAANRPLSTSAGLTAGEMATSGALGVRHDPLDLEKYIQ